jgi:hypothetical protein
VALTAPQLLWPNTKISFVPSTAAPNSKLASPSGVTKFVGNTDHEQVARPLVECQLGRNPGISAAEDRGEWRLAQCPARPSRRKITLAWFVRDVAHIAFHQEL